MVRRKNDPKTNIHKSEPNIISVGNYGGATGTVPFKLESPILNFGGVGAGGGGGSSNPDDVNISKMSDKKLTRELTSRGYYCSKEEIPAFSNKELMAIASDIYSWCRILELIKQLRKDENNSSAIKWIVDLVYNDINRVSNELYDVLGPVE